MQGLNLMPQFAIAQISEGAGVDPMATMAAANVTYKKTPEEERSWWMAKLENLRI